VAILGEIVMVNIGYNHTHGVGTHGFHPSLFQQCKGMKNEDQGEVQQKAIPVCVTENSTALHNSYQRIMPTHIQL
jgi:hypothetical protein